MARILADKDIRKLIGTAIVDANPDCLNPNGIELRLGADVLFHSTGEDKELQAGAFLKVHPGETVVISSMETIDFTRDTVGRLFPGKMLMGLITPTTTMMREGIAQVATKIDAGFRGTLNWSLRNGATRDLIIQHGEPIFKLTIFLLDADESPEIPYGDRAQDSYHAAEGIVRSRRRIPADIPARKIVSSSFDKLDPKKQLREAGYPFDHIGTELTVLHGRFETVSSDVVLMKEEFKSRINELSSKIDGETRTLSARVDEAKATVLERVEILFDRKFIRIVGVIIGAGPIMYGGLAFMRDAELTADVIGFIAILVGIAILAITFLVSRTIRDRPAE